MAPMALITTGSLVRAPRVRETDGAPEPETDENTVWLGKQPDEGAEAKPAKSKQA
jgi:hypothetical protein